MIKLLLALVITVMSTTANARSSDPFSFIQCGVKLGSKYLTYKPTSDRPSKKDTRFSHVARVAKTRSSGFTLSDAGTASLPASLADTPLPVEFRLPRKVTVASFGCSWR